MATRLTKGCTVGPWRGAQWGHGGVHSGAREGCTVEPGRGAQWGQVGVHSGAREGCTVGPDDDICSN